MSSTTGPTPPLITAGGESGYIAPATHAASSQPLGSAYTPSLPSPYPPGEEPPANPDLGDGPLGPPGTQNFALPVDNGASGGDLAPLTGPITPTTPTQ